MAYLRVSTSGQDAENQRADIIRAAAARGDGELTFYVDVGTGRSWQRPALAELSAAIFRGGVSRVYVWKLDRLGRMSMADTLQLVQQWRRAGMHELLSAVEGFDFGHPLIGDWLVAMLAAMAKWEWEQQQDRLRAARERREAAGKGWGRPSKTREIEPRVRELRARGDSVRQIAVALKVPKSTVSEVLKKAAKSGGG